VEGGGLGNGLKYDLVLVAWQNQLAYGDGDGDDDDDDKGRSNKNM